MERLTIPKLDWAKHTDALLLAVVRGDVAWVRRHGLPYRRVYGYYKSFRINLGRAFLQNPVPGMFSALADLNLEPQCYDSCKSFDYGGERTTDRLVHTALHDKPLPEAILREILEVQIDEKSEIRDIESACMCRPYTACAIRNGNEGFLFMVLDVMQRKRVRRHAFLGCVVEAYKDLIFFFQTRDKESKCPYDQLRAEWHTKIMCVMERIIPMGWSPYADDVRELMGEDGLDKCLERLELAFRALRMYESTEYRVICATDALETLLLVYYKRWLFLPLPDLLKVAFFFVRNGAKAPAFQARLQHIENLDSVHVKYRSDYFRQAIIRQEAFRRELDRIGGLASDDETRSGASDMIQ